MKLTKEFKQDIANAAHVEETLHRRPYTIATVTMEYDGRTIVAAGLATCGKHDVWSDDLGAAIATGRAKHNLAKKLAIIRMRQRKDEVSHDICNTLWSIKQRSE